MMNEQSNNRVRQILQFGSIRQERESAGDTMFANTGRRLYVIGDIDGKFRPRSNPYDVYALGHPDPKDPLANKLQGVWVQPVKGFHAYGYRLEAAGRQVDLDDANEFVQDFSSATFKFHHHSLAFTRVDFAALDLPVLFTTLSIENQGQEPAGGRIVFWAQFDLQDAWFTSLAERRNQGQEVSVEGECLVARAEVNPQAWSAAVKGAEPPVEVKLASKDRGELVYEFHLAPGERTTLSFGLAVVYQGENPVQLLGEALAKRWEILREKQDWYRRAYETAPRLVSPDEAWNQAFTLAVINHLVLEAEQPSIGRYYYAGLEMFPFWFGGDGAYSLVGMMVARRVREGLNHLEIGARWQQAGRIPHQVSPSGRLAFSGSAQETPLWVCSLWEAYRWTGDQDFLRRVYPTARQGLLEYTLGVIDPDGDGYASGPGVVEREDMGEEKLDTAAYTWAGLLALAEMASELDDPATAQQARQQAAQIEQRFDADWWDDAGQTYSMSLDAHNKIYPVPHWAVVVPLEVGLAAPGHAAQTIESMRRDYLNAWGLKHTAGDDERVWTLPTAVFSRGAYRYGEPGLGFFLLGCVAKTLEHGPIGVFHELIPQGACFVQLWSASTFLRGVVEDLLGLEVNAPQHRLTVQPRLPQGWCQVRIEGLVFGEHTVNVALDEQGCQVVHVAGSNPLAVQYKDVKWVLPGAAKA